MNKWFIVEGNIGSGKTTLLDKLDNHPNNEVIREPVDIWINTKGSNNKNLLQEFYEEPERYAYLFQTMVFKTRLQSLDIPQIKNIRFSERSIWTDRYVFGKSCINNSKMNTLEINCYYKWFNWLEDKFFKKPDGIIYLQTSPHICYQRMQKRGRSEESHVPLEYLTEIHNYHEEWLQNWNETPLLVINNNNDNNWEQVMNQVYHFVNLYK